MTRRNFNLLAIAFAGVIAAVVAIVVVNLNAHQPANAKFKVLSLGDSYTIGQSVDISDRWPVQLAAALRKSGIDVGEPMIIARTGWTTNELSSAMDAEKISGPFHLVTLQIGVNNQFRGYDIKKYPDEISTLLKRAVELAGGDASRVIVVSIPDWGVTPFAEGRDRDAIGKEIDAYNSINESETKKIGASFVNITPISRQATTQPNLVAIDGLHPSGEMYRQWVEAILPQAKIAIIGQPKSP